MANDAGLDCFADTYTVLLRDVGIDPRVLGDDWGYRYVAPEVAASEPFLRLRINRHEYRDSIFRWYGIAERRISHSSDRALWGHVDEVLADGRQVALQLDTFFYPNSPFHRRIHHLHRVVVAGRRDLDVYVLDEFPGRPFRGWLPVDVLNQAIRSDVLASQYAGVGGKRCSVDLPPPPWVAQPAVADLEAALMANVQSYLGEQGDSAAPVGWCAVQRFLSDVRRYAANGSQVDQSLITDGVNFFAALAKQRRQNALFVQLVGDRGGVRVDEAVNQLRDISHRLDQVRAFFFFGASAGRPTGEHVGRLADRLTQTFFEEYDCMRRLSHLL